MGDRNRTSAGRLVTLEARALEILADLGDPVPELHYADRQVAYGRALARLRARYPDEFARLRRIETRALAATPDWRNGPCRYRDPAGAAAHDRACAAVWTEIRHRYGEGA